MGSSKPVAIEVSDLVYSVGGRRVLDGVSLSVNHGEIFGVMGMSGSGKSTLLRNIMGLIAPDSGDVRIDGRSLIGLSERDLNGVRLKMGMCFQYSALFDSLTVRENVLFGLRGRRYFPPAELDRLCAQHLEVVGMTGSESLMPSELSGGMRKRVSIARALILQPTVMLYDEPSAGLDPVTAAMVGGLITKVTAEFGVASMVVTHEVHQLLRLAGRVGFLHDGRLVVTDSPEGLRRSTDPLVQQFVTGSAEGPIRV